MKRSEMIELMVHRMEGFAEKNPGCSVEAVMDYVLKGMEAMGMLPPTVTGTVQTETQDDGSIVLTLWKWEAE